MIFLFSIKVGIHKLSYDNLTVILKPGALSLSKCPPKMPMIILGPRHPWQNNDHKKFVNYFCKYKP